MNINETQKDLTGSILLLKDIGKEECTCVVTGINAQYWQVNFFMFDSNKFLSHSFYSREEFERFLKKERIYGDGYFKAFYIEIIN